MENVICQIRKKGILNVDKIIAVLLVLVPVIGIYKVGFLNVSLGEVLILAIMAITILHKKKIYKPSTGFMQCLLVYFIFSIIVIFFQGEISISDFAKKWFKLIMYYSVIELLAHTGFDDFYAKKLYIKIAVIVSLILIYQVILQVFEIYIFPYLPYPELYYNINQEALRNQWTDYLSQGIWRPSSVFAEPADYAQYCLMPLIFLFFNCDGGKIRTWIERIIIILGLMLSRSSIGIICMVIVLFFWLFGKKGFRLKRWDILAIIAAIPVGVLVITQTEIFSSALDRVKSFSITGGMTTANLRFMQGIFIFQHMPAINKVLGIGVGNLHHYLVVNEVVTPYLNDIGNEYMNGFSTILVTTGILGIILYIITLFVLYKKLTILEDKVLFFILIILFMTASIFYVNIIVLFYAFLFCGAKKKDLKKI